MAHIIPTLLSATEAQVAQLPAAAAEEDFESVARIAYAIKGSAGTLEAEPLSDPARKSEREGNVGGAGERATRCGGVRQDGQLPRGTRNRVGGNA